MRFSALLLLIAVPAGAQMIYHGRRFSMDADSIREGSSEARAISANEIESNYGNATRQWKLQTDISGYPAVHSGQTLIDALYNLSLEEMHKDIRPDGAFMAGAKWEGVWTRDISYSIFLALAIVEPEAARKSLLAKVARGRIIQDTGTGGSWPCSTDRMTWALAAWEIYEVTGDKAWLEQAFGIIRDSAADDQQVIFSKETGMVFGESSFLDWREQTYPRWMSPVDIYGSIALGTNAVHYRTYRILAEMARLLGQSATEFDATADRIRDGVNQHLWLEQNGFYGQYLYGYNALSASPRSEALGEALTILFDIAPPQRQDRILQTVPVMDYGIPCIYPQTPGVPNYHNNAVWPFVQAIWNLAAAKRHDGSALLPGMAAIYRAAALFLTNQENLVADTGTAAGTEINSPRQLWSVAGNLAMTYRVRFGMTFEDAGLRLSPVVPKELGGVSSLFGFRYRKATLNIRVEGYGSAVSSVTMDGEALSGALVPAGTEGEHQIRVVLANDDLPTPGQHLVDPRVAPETPAAKQDSAMLHWSAAPGADHYVIVRNGVTLKDSDSDVFTLPISGGYAEYQVSAVDPQGAHSFLSEPVADYAEDRVTTAKPDTSGAGPVEISRTLNRTVTFHVSVKTAGTYAVDFHYANGSGPINTDNKCAIRTLAVNGKIAGAIVMPQRGKDDWSNWGYSSRQRMQLSPGSYEMELRFEPSDENMNGDVNRALIEHIRLMHIFDTPAPRF